MADHRPFRPRMPTPVSRLVGLALALALTPTLPDALPPTAPSAVAQSPEPKPAPPSGVTASEPATPASGVDGAAYLSPVWGFSVSWDPAVWAVRAEASEGDYDGIQLGTASSNVWVEGFAGFDGDAAACLDDAEAEIAAREGVSNLTTLPPGRPVPLPPESGFAQRLYRYDQAFSEAEGDTAPIVEFSACNTLVPGESVLEVTMQTAGQDYNAELPLAEALLATLALPETGATPEPEADEAA